MGAAFGDGGPHLLDDGTEAVGLLPGELGKHLSVEANVGLVEPVYQLIITHAVLPRGGIYLHDGGAARGARVL